VSEIGQPQVQIKDVAKLYGDHNVQALSGISLDIAQGEFIALMGASGCGKSTLLNIIGGIDRATSGSVLVNGDDLAKMNDDQLTRVRATKIGFIFSILQFTFDAHGPGKRGFASGASGKDKSSRYKKEG